MNVNDSIIWIKGLTNQTDYQEIVKVVSFSCNPDTILKRKLPSMLAEMQPQAHNCNTYTCNRKSLLPLSCLTVNCLQWSDRKLADRLPCCWFPVKVIIELGGNFLSRSESH